LQFPLQIDKKMEFRDINPALQFSPPGEMPTTLTPTRAALEFSRCFSRHYCFGMSLYSKKLSKWAPI